MHNKNYNLTAINGGITDIAKNINMENYLSRGINHENMKFFFMKDIYILVLCSADKENRLTERVRIMMRREI